LLSELFIDEFDQLTRMLDEIRDRARFPDRLANSYASPIVRRNASHARSNVLMLQVPL
jgi:hypothetical protein